MKIYEITSKETPIHRLSPSYWSEQPFAYANQLRTVWMKMVERYPQHYTMEDVAEAMERLNNPSIK